MNEPQTPSSRDEPGVSAKKHGTWESVPGLLPRWDIPRVIHPSMEFYLEEHGTHDGVELFKVYRRRVRKTTLAPDVGLPVDLSCDGEFVPLRARLLPLDDDEPMMAALVIEPDQREALARLRERLARATPGAGPSSTMSGLRVLPQGTPR